MAHSPDHARCPSGKRDVTLAGKVRNGSAENRDFKETAIGEATALAVQDLVEKLEAKRSLLAMR